MSFNIGLSGLYAAQKDLAVTGNNIANSATTGFKESRAEFANVYGQFRGCIASSGTGVRVASVAQQFHQGTIEQTKSSLDLAISGEGFFAVSDGDQMGYTRDGSFRVDNEGYIVTNSGARLQAYPRANNSDGFAYNLDPGGTLEEVSPDLNISDANPVFTRELGDIQLQFSGLQPRASSTVGVDLNLASDAEFIYESDGGGGLVATPFREDDPDSYNYSTTVTLYDSLGASRNVTMYFSKVGDATVTPPTSTPGEWDVYFQMEGTTSDDTTTPPTITPAYTGPIRLVFDSNGNLTTLDGTTINRSDPSTGTYSLDLSATFANYIPQNGATIGPLGAGGVGNNIVSFNFMEMTQFGSNYNINDLTQDGYATGNLLEFGVNEEGILSARYSNGQQRAIAQIPLTSFKNPQGLKQVGNNLWVQTQSSGEAVTDIPGSGRLGTIQSCSLESSNVDLATELVDLIKAQRSYQANAKTISAADEITQTVINMR